MTKGSGPNISLNYDATKNRITSSGYTYLSNGNLTAMPDAQGRAQTLEYDVLNRLSHYLVSGTNEYYGYDHENRRVWKKNTQEEYYFYGAFRELIGRYKKIRGTVCEYCEGFQVLARNVYVVGKLIRSQDGVAVVDRLGSVVGKKQGSEKAGVSPSEKAGVSP